MTASLSAASLTKRARSRGASHSRARMALAPRRSRARREGPTQHNVITSCFHALRGFSERAVSILARTFQRVENLSSALSPHLGGWFTRIIRTTRQDGTGVLRFLLA
jgi:hypothetical protein